MITDSHQRIVLQGELSIYTAAEWKQCLDEVLAQNVDIELELSALTELDTAGLQLLIMAKREATLRNKKLWLNNPSLIALEVFELCGISSFFDEHFLPNESPLKGSAHELR